MAVARTGEVPSGTSRAGDTVLPMAPPRRRSTRAWWRTPVLRSAPRRRVELALAATTAVALGLGTGAGAAVEALTTDAGTSDAPPVAGTATELGPVTITLPDELGPWTPASDAAAAELRAAWTGAVELDGVWGVLAPGSVVVTVLTAEAGSHGGVAQFEDSVPAGEAVWSGDREHASGSRTVDDLRELVLVVEAEGGDLVVLSVSGPRSAFASGSLAEAFRTARIG